MKYLLFFLFALSFGHSLAYGADWTALRSTGIGNAYYDRENIEKVAEKTIKVSVKYVYSPEGIEQFRQAFPDIDPKESVSYTIYHYQMNCSSSSFKMLKAVTYNSKGFAIEGTELEQRESTPEHVTPNSMMEQLLYAACNRAHYGP